MAVIFVYRIRYTCTGSGTHIFNLLKRMSCLVLNQIKTSHINRAPNFTLGGLFKPEFLVFTRGCSSKSKIFFSSPGPTNLSTDILGDDSSQ